MKRDSDSRASVDIEHSSSRASLIDAIRRDGLCEEVPAASRRRRRISRAQRGVAAVEFAIVLPLLLLVLFGIVEFGVALYDKAMITNASREGARAGVVLRTPKPNAQDITNVVLAYSRNYLITFGSSNTPTVSVPSGIGGTFGTPLTVTVSYQYAGLGLGAMLSAFTGPIVMTATTIMNNE
jgi:Flp pilus assembly protein TadG